MPSVPHRFAPVDEELPPISSDLKYFARIEDLIGEEAALLLIPAKGRNKHQRERLITIAAELDKLWDRLRERAERLAHRAPPGEATS